MPSGPRHPSRREVIAAAALSEAFLWAAAPAEAAAQSSSSGIAAIGRFATLAALAGADPALGLAGLGEPGRQGVFAFVEGDLSRDVRSDPMQGIHVAPRTDATGRSGAWVRIRDGDRVHASWFGAGGSGDRTRALQAAFDYVVRDSLNISEELVIGDIETDTIHLRTTTDIVRLRLSVEGIWANRSADGPHISLGPEHRTNWGWHIRGRGMITWTTEGDSRTGRNRCFLYVADTGRNYGLYNSRIEGLSFTRGHYFVRADGDLWGIEFENLPLIRPTGGFVSTTAQGGALPRIVYKGVYLWLSEAAGPVFDHHGGVNATYVGVELNLLNHSPVIISDVAGGDHVIVMMAVETGHYAVPGRRMFEMLNSRLLIQYLYLHALRITAPTTIFITQGEGYVRGTVSLSAQIGGSGALFVAGGGEIVLDEIKVRTAGTQFGGDSPPFLALTDMVATDAAESVFVRQWAENRHPRRLGDADHRLRHDDPTEIALAEPLTQDRTISLPPVTNLWSGRCWTIRKLSAEGSGSLIVADRQSGRITGTIPAGRAGALRLTFFRNLHRAADFGWTCETFLQG